MPVLLFKKNDDLQKNVKGFRLVLPQVWLFGLFFRTVLFMVNENMVPLSVGILLNVVTISSKIFNLKRIKRK